MDLGSIVSAAATGPVGIALGGLFGIAKKWGENRHEAKMLTIKTQERALDRQHDLDLASKEIESDQIKGQMRLDEKMFEVDSKALSAASASQDAEISALGRVIDKMHPSAITFFVGPMFALVTFVQKMIRPVLTAVLIYMAWDIFTQINVYIGRTVEASDTFSGLEEIDREVLLQIYLMTIQTILNMAAMAGTFWFVGRPPKTGSLI